MLMILALVAAVLLLFAAMFSRVPVRAARVLVVPGVPAMRAAWARATAGRSSAPASAAWRCVRRAAPGARSSSRPSAMRSLRGVRGGLRRRCRRRCSPRRPAAIRSAPASTGPGSRPAVPVRCGRLTRVRRARLGASAATAYPLLMAATEFPARAGMYDAHPSRSSLRVAAASFCPGVCSALHSSPPLGLVAAYAERCTARRRLVSPAYAARCTGRRRLVWPRRMQRAVAAARFRGGVCSALHTRLERLLVAGCRSACLTLSLAPVAPSNRPL